MSKYSTHCEIGTGGLSVHYFHNRWLELPEQCRDCFFILTLRERDVFLAYVVGSRTTQEVAEHLCIHVKTVESHRQNIMRKFRFKGMMDWVKYAYEKGILPVKEVKNGGKD